MSQAAMHAACETLAESASWRIAVALHMEVSATVVLLTGEFGVMSPSQIHTRNHGCISVRMRMQLSQYDTTVR